MATAPISPCGGAGNGFASISRPGRRLGPGPAEAVQGVTEGSVTGSSRRPAIGAFAEVVMRAAPPAGIITGSAGRLRGGSEMRCALHRPRPLEDSAGGRRGGAGGSCLAQAEGAALVAQVPIVSAITTVGLL